MARLWFLNPYRRLQLGETSEKTLDEAGEDLFSMLMRAINGRLTAAEALGHVEFVLTKL